MKTKNVAFHSKVNNRPKWEKIPHFLYLCFLTNSILC